MTYSMTGMGQASIEEKDYSVSVEIRSVNNRYLDISCKLPAALLPFEQKIRDVIKKRVHRGKIHLMISGDFDNEPYNIPITLNRAKVKAVSNLLDKLINEAGINEKPRIEHFLNFSEIFEPEEKHEYNESLWNLVEKGLNAAIDQLIAMRKTEGNALASDLSERLKEMQQSITKIEKIAKENVKKTFEKMTNRVEALIKNAEIDNDRLYTEIVIIADKLDISEECVRLCSHINIFSNTLTDSEIVGKKLNFILQEMNREVNTISSKASNFKISHIVVDLKEKVEMMREQVQNLE